MQAKPLPWVAYQTAASKSLAALANLVIKDDIATRPRSSCFQNMDDPIACVVDVLAGVNQSILNGILSGNLARARQTSPMTRNILATQFREASGGRADQRPRPAAYLLSVLNLVDEPPSLSQSKQIIALMQAYCQPDSLLSSPENARFVRSMNRAYGHDTHSRPLLITKAAPSQNSRTTVGKFCDAFAQRLAHLRRQDPTSVDRPLPFAPSYAGFTYCIDNRFDDHVRGLSSYYILFRSPRLSIVGYRVPVK